MAFLQRLTLYLFFFSINFEVWDPLNTGGSFSVAKLTGFIYLAVMIPSIVSFVSRKELKTYLNPVLLFILLLTVINLFNISPTSGSFFEVSMLQNIALFYILINHENIDRHVLEKGLLSFASGSVVFALLFAMGIGIEYSPGGRVTLFGDNQNIIGIKMCISILILMFMVIQNPLNAGKSRYFLLLPIPIMLQLLVFTASRVSMLALVLAILAGISLLGTLKLSSKILMIMSGLLVFGIAWIYMLQSDVMGMRFLLILQERDLSGRDIIWQNIIPLIKENPVFGVGTTGYTDFSQNTFGLYNSPHNVFLEILCYTGIVGLGIYLIFLYRIAVKSFKVFKHQRILLPLILMIPIMGMIGTSQILGVKTGWILFAYIAASSAGLESGSRSDQLSGPGRT